jgi:hypothetical protein
MKICGLNKAVFQHLPEGNNNINNGKSRWKSQLTRPVSQAGPASEITYVLNIIFNFKLTYEKDVQE